MRSYYVEFFKLGRNKVFYPLGGPGDNEFMFSNTIYESHSSRPLHGLEFAKSLAREFVHCLQRTKGGYYYSVGSAQSCYERDYYVGFKMLQGTGRPYAAKIAIDYYEDKEEDNTRIYPSLLSVEKVTIPAITTRIEQVVNGIKGE